MYETEAITDLFCPSKKMVKILEFICNFLVEKQACFCFKVLEEVSVSHTNQFSHFVSNEI